MGWEVKTDMWGQPKHGLWKSNVKTGKYLPGADRSEFLVLFGPKSYNTMCYLIPSSCTSLLALTGGEVSKDNKFLNKIYIS